MSSIRHPNYMCDCLDWTLWRDTKESGTAFVERYLQKFSTRESEDDYRIRLRVTPCPAYAKAALLEVRNGIYAKMQDIVRQGGSDTYRAAIEGVRGGVDHSGKSMNYFVGFQVLEELLAMKRVGIMVDRPRQVRRTKADAPEAPYLYMYATEDIMSWAYDREGRLERVLLRETIEQYNQGYPSGTETVYRWMERTESGVTVKLTDPNEKVILEDVLALDDIPFVIAEISDSLFKDTAIYQIALLNMESSDINFVLQSNFPFYTEQAQMSARDYTNQPEEGTKVEVGVTKGRRYGPSMERPGFIHPSSEPITASMAKQKDMQQTIRHLMHLTIASLKPIRSSAESKDKDQDGLRSGLAYIGLELERVERQISIFWHNYTNEMPATVHYPRDFSIETEEQRIARAGSLKPLMNLPSITYRREIATCMSEMLLRDRVTPETLDTIRQEIESSRIINMDPEDIRKDVETGFLDHASAATANAYPATIVAIAKQEHIDRLTAIALAQSSVRGVAPGAAAADKLDPASENGRTPSRGDAE